MPAHCVRARRLRRGVRPLWARRWGAGLSRGYGVRRRVRSSVRRMLCANIGRLQNGRRPLEKRSVEPAVPSRSPFGTPGTAGSVEAAMDPRAVWVNGAVGEPEVVGPAGSVWVTVSGEEPDNRSSPSCERKGRPGTVGHESILELWLKVQAMRVASGCWEGSRVELYPVPAGEGPVEKGIPGLASWVETSQGGVTGPWVRGYIRTSPQASGLPTARGLGAGCERVSILCRQGRQAGKTPPAVGGPEVVEKVDCAASGPWEKRQIVVVPEAIGCSQVLKRPRVGEVRECGGTSCLCVGGQSGQVSGALAEGAEYGHMLWERGQIEGGPDALLVLPRAMEDETTSHGAPGLWQRRQEVEDIGSRGIPGLRTMGLVGVPCAREEEARCGGDPGSWGAPQTAELCASEEHEIGGAQGLWGIEQAMGAPRALGKEADDASIPGLWGTGQLPGLQTVVVPGGREEETSYDVSGLWERQQPAQEAPLAEPLPGPVMEETYNGNPLSLWERRQVMREPEAQGPAALGIPGAVDQDVRCGDLSCLCGRRRAVGLTEAIVPKHRWATEGVPSALGVPAALWVCQESSSTDGVNLPGRTHVACSRPVAPEECSSVVEDAEPGALPCSWGRRPAIGVPLAPELPGSLKIEAGTGSFSSFSGRRETVGIPVTVGVSPAGVGVAFGASDSVWEHSYRRASDSGGRPPTRVPVTVALPESAGDVTLTEDVQRRQPAVMPVAARIPTTVGEPIASGLCGPHRVVDRGCGESSGIWQRRPMTEVPTAASVPEFEREAGSEGLSDLWRRHSGTVPEAAREALHQGRVPMVRHVPAPVWVTGPSGEEAGEGVSDLTVVRRLATEGVRASGEETVRRGSLGLVGRGQAVEVSYTSKLGTRMWVSPGSAGEVTTYENLPRASAVRTTVPAVSGHFRDDLQGNGKRAVGGIPEARLTVDALGEMGEGELRGTFQ